MEGFPIRILRFIVVVTWCSAWREWLRRGSPFFGRISLSIHQLLLLLL